jgi:hypothetical protein
VAEPPPARPSCPDCGARANAGSAACAECGYPIVEDSPRGGRPRRHPAGAERRRFATYALAAGALVAAAAAALLVATGGGDAGGAGQNRPSAAAERRSGPEVLSRRPLSARAAERRLEQRFVSARDDDTASARCSALQPRPAHAIRWCRIRYARGGERTVIVLSNPQGHELLVER